MTTTARRALLYIVIVALAGIVLCVLFAAASAAPCEDTDPCYAEPQPLPRLYLPHVARDVPPMAWEYAPYAPAPTVTPDVQ